MRGKITPIVAVCLGREFDTKRLARDLPGNVLFTKWWEPVEVNVHGIRAFIYAFGTIVFLSGRTKTVESFVRKMKKYGPLRLRTLFRISSS